MNKDVILGYAIAAVLLIIGLGIMAFVFISTLKKMKNEYNETGYYPYGYFSLKGTLYSIPLAILVGYLLFPYYEVLSRWSSFPYVSAVCLPGILIGFILEKRNKAIVRPRTASEKQKKNKIGLMAAILLASLILYRIFILKH